MMNAEIKSREQEWGAETIPLQVIPTYDKIAAALAQAQGVMQNPGFDSTNPHFRNKFASLAAVRNAVVPVFAKYGIAVMQDLTSLDGAVSCTTLLYHSSGQSLRFGPLVLPVAKNDAQGFGSAATYCRRYSLMAVACVVGDDDDDANAATGKPTEIHSPKGDLGKNVPTDQAREIAMQMIAIIDKPAADGDHDELKKAAEALDYHERVLNPDADLYVAVGEQLSASKRNTWKALVKKAQLAQAAEPKGRRF